MKILILGLSGMLGHKLFSYLQKQNTYDLYATTTTNFEIEYPSFKIINKKNIFFSKVQNIDYFERIFLKINPDIVINCIAILRESFFDLKPVKFIEINTIYPHKISQLSKKLDFRFIHFSTDILYSDNNKLSCENDEIALSGPYAASKFLGEVKNNNSLTIRTSIIGHQLNNNTSLLEWFLNYEGKTVNGYSNVIYSGLPTTEISKIIHKYIIPNVDLKGIMNISSKPISKLELLYKIKKYYNKKVNINSDESIISNRSLNSNLFNKKTGYLVPDWDMMVKEMYEDFLIEKNI
jgi:dTDP-4-dehydrorhamnose reductase